MTNGGDAADEVVRMMLSGTEVTLRLTASATKNLLALSFALAQNHKKLCGRTSMKKMLRETRDLRVFSMTKEQFQAFQKESKRMGLLYAAIRDKGGDSPIDVILPETELDRANLVLTKIRYGQTKEESEPDKTKNELCQPDASKKEDRSRPGLTVTDSRASSGDTIQTTSSRISIEERLNGYRVQLTQQRAPVKQRAQMQAKRMAHKKNRAQRG